MKLFTLFFFCAIALYAVNIVFRHSAWWGWVQFFAPTAALLLPALAAGLFVAHRLQWLSVQLTAGRCLSAAFVVAVSYPLAFVSAIALGVVFDQLRSYAWLESFPRLHSLMGQVNVDLGALVIPLLVYGSLRIITGRRDIVILMLMLGAVAGVLVMIRIVQAFAGERGDSVVGVMFFPFFPLGFSLLSALYGYGLARADSGS